MEEEWSSPMTRTEMARRLTGNSKARHREVKHFLQQFGLRHVNGKKYQIRLDKMDAYTRQNIEKRPE